MNPPFSNLKAVMGISIVCTILALTWMVREKILLHETASEHAKFTQAYEQIKAYKTRWLSQQLKQQKLDFLLQHAKMTHQEKSTQRLLLEYSGLDAHEMDKLLGLLLNDTFLIKSLTIKHDSGILKVEIEQ